MSIQHCRSKNTTKKIKLDKVDKDISSIAEYKRCAVLKYCKENGIEKNNLEELFISNKLRNSGLYYILYQY